MKEITASQLREMQEKKASLHLIDVREPYEHEEFNLGGQLIPLAELMDHEAELKSLSQTGDLVLYCRSGNRSSMAQKILAAKMGIQNTMNLRGGIIMWTD